MLLLDVNQNKTNDGINVPTARSVNQIAIAYINLSVQTAGSSTEASYELYDSFGIKTKGGTITIENGKFSIFCSGYPTRCLPFKRSI